MYRLPDRHEYVLTDEEYSALMKKLENLRSDRYLLLGEIMRTRRQMSIVIEEHDDIKAEKERAERRIRNLQRWMKINKLGYGERADNDT